MLRKIVPFALSGALALGLAVPAAMAQSSTAAPTTTDQSATSTHHRRHHRRMSPERQLRMLTKHLNLTTEQQSQIKPLLVSRQEQMRALWKDQSLSRQDKFQKMRGIQQDTSTKINAVLNPTQQQEFEAMQKRMHERMEQHRQMGGQASPQM